MCCPSGSEYTNVAVGDLRLYRTLYISWADITLWVCHCWMVDNTFTVWKSRLCLHLWPLTMDHQIRTEQPSIEPAYWLIQYWSWPLDQFPLVFGLGLQFRSCSGCPLEATEKPLLLSYHLDRNHTRKKKCVEGIEMWSERREDSAASVQRKGGEVISEWWWVLDFERIHSSLALCEFVVHYIVYTGDLQLQPSRATDLQLLDIFLLQHTWMRFELPPWYISKFWKSLFVNHSFNSGVLEQMHPNTAGEWHSRSVNAEFIVSTYGLITTDSESGTI